MRGFQHDNFHPPGWLWLPAHLGGGAVHAVLGLPHWGMMFVSTKLSWGGTPGPKKRLGLRPTRTLPLGQAGVLTLLVPTRPAQRVQEPRKELCTS